MISGGSKLAYWLSNFAIDAIFHAIPSMFAVYLIGYYEIDAPQIWWAFAMFTVANPLFIYAISLVFDNDAKASVLIRVSYFAIGGVAPLVQRVLYVIDNPRVWDWADYLKRYYVFCPIFNLNDAYINISNRKIIALVKKQDPDHF